MDAKEYLKDYVKKVEPVLQDFFSKKISEAKKISPICEEMMKIYKEFMRGGKKMRGGLIKLGYECFGGKNEKAVLSASSTIETIHSFLLMHDDVFDEDPLRRGKPTIHKQYESIYRKRRRFEKGSPGHYGLCLAIDLGDTGPFLAYEMLSTSLFSDNVKLRAVRLLNKIVLNTGFGQALDITYELYPEVDYKDVLRVHKNKTAYYTVTGPLSLGATLAGASEEDIKKIELYGEPVGIAFQIRDDELGLFSDEKSLGKPIGSDVKQNKNTLLHLRALEKAGRGDKKFLEYAYGNRDLTDEEIERVREITVKTGALKYSQRTGWDLVRKGKKQIKEVTKDLYHQKLLASFADLMIEREH